MEKRTFSDALQFHLIGIALTYMLVNSYEGGEYLRAGIIAAGVMVFMRINRLN